MFVDAVECGCFQLQVTPAEAPAKILWVFGAEFSMVVSNTTLATLLKKYTDEIHGSTSTTPPRPVAADAPRTALQARRIETPELHPGSPGHQPSRTTPRRPHRTSTTHRRSRAR